MSAGFELLRFEAVPASGAVAVLELDGHFDGPAPARVRLLVERGGRSVEVPAVTAGGDDPWSATFAVALDDLADPATELALVLGRGALIGLPAPEQGDGGGVQDRYVELARQANTLRRRLGELEAAADAHDDEVQAAEDERDASRAELAAARRRADEAAAAAREELEAAERRTADAERTTQALRDQRDSTAANADHTRDQLDRARDQLREVEGRLVEAERERASLRARAESAERGAADLRNRVTDAEDRAKAVEGRLVAAEDETRTARRDLRDTRARLESLLREQRHPGPERRGHEVPEPAPGADAAETAALTAPPEDDDAEAATGVVAPDTADDAEPDDEPGPSGGGAAQPDDTAVLETARIDRATLTETGDAPGEDDDDNPPAAPARKARVVRIFDDPMADGPDAVLDPAAVGARHIEPADTAGPTLTPARIMVGVALALLLVALLAILLGAGIV